MEYRAVGEDEEVQLFGQNVGNKDVTSPHVSGIHWCV